MAGRAVQKAAKRKYRILFARHGCGGSDVDADVVFVNILPKFHMIKSIKLTNFFSFKSEEIIFDPEVNILIGINGSGKSNLFKAIKVLKVGIEGNSNDNALRELIIDNWGGFDSIFFKGSSEVKYKNSIGIEFLLDGKELSKYGGYNFRGDVFYKIALIKKPSTDNYYTSEKISLSSGTRFTFLHFTNGEGVVFEKLDEVGARQVKYDDYNSQELALSKISEFDKDRYLPLVTIKRAIKDIAVYDYFDTTFNSKLRKAMPATTSEKKLQYDGGNLPQMINYIKNHHKDYYKEVLRQLNDVNSMYTGFDFNFYGSGAFELMLEEVGLKESVHINHISDGTLRYLCLLCIFSNPERGKLICIDEPEIGLHPDMIYNIAKAIEKASETTKFIIATHSEYLLNLFKLSNVRIFEKAENNETLVNSYSEEDFEAWHEEFGIGKMWRQGDIGGNRF